MRRNMDGGAETHVLLSSFHELYSQIVDQSQMLLLLLFGLLYIAA